MCLLLHLFRRVSGVSVVQTRQCSEPAIVCTRLESKVLVRIRIGGSLVHRNVCEGLDADLSNGWPPHHYIDQTHMQFLFTISCRSGTGGTSCIGMK